MLQNGGQGLIGLQKRASQRPVTTRLHARAAHHSLVSYLVCRGIVQPDSGLHWCCVHQCSHDAVTHRRRQLCHLLALGRFRTSLRALVRHLAAMTLSQLLLNMPRQSSPERVCSRSLAVQHWFHSSASNRCSAFECGEVTTRITLSSLKWSYERQHSYRVQRCRPFTKCSRDITSGAPRSSYTQGALREGHRLRLEEVHHLEPPQLMAAKGAAMQTQNNELVNCECTLCKLEDTCEQQLCPPQTLLPPSSLPGARALGVTSQGAQLQSHMQASRRCGSGGTRCSIKSRVKKRRSPGSSRKLQSSPSSWRS